VDQLDYVWKKWKLSQNLDPFETIYIHSLTKSDLIFLRLSMNWQYKYRNKLKFGKIIIWSSDFQLSLLKRCSLFMSMENLAAFLSRINK